MVSKKIKLAGIEQVQTFNQICSRCEYNVDLKQGKYLVDAKSIMGIYSLNIMGELELQAGTDSEKEVEETFKDYII
ncbi:MAG: HPr family phosphocarrier protein [Lachnospiraceae bacterium]|jgi:phosphocarrier protein HPr|nr:HPr family phosphocarrier protein [Lachnospiraceae bacterium]